MMPCQHLGPLWGEQQGPHGLCQRPAAQLLLGLGLGVLQWLLALVAPCGIRAQVLAAVGSAEDVLLQAAGGKQGRWVLSKLGGWTGQGSCGPAA